ncbi:MAG: hypothetical protein IJU96_00460, partial [Clostridia bacterium]|nr:hypothetical protein [Clostridia bacterium]MBQ9551212.1 hypothetical protein [Clostridia bacterium]
RRSIARTFHRHIAQIFLESREDSCVKFMQSDDKICIALKRPEFLEVPCFILVRAAQIGNRRCRAADFTRR